MDAANIDQSKLLINQSLPPFVAGKAVTTWTFLKVRLPRRFALFQKPNWLKDGRWRFEIGPAPVVLIFWHQGTVENRMLARNGRKASDFVKVDVCPALDRKSVV